MTDWPPSPDHKLAVFAAWQKTMRVFLEGQEAAMRAVLARRNDSALSLAPTVLRPVIATEASCGRVERFVMRGRKRPLPSQADGRLAGLYLVAGDADLLSRAVIESLRDRGAAPAGI